jgi:hypothetical protein
VPGRRVRVQVGVERLADEECADRLRKLEGRLLKLDSALVADLLAKDAAKGEITPALLLSRMVGYFGEVQKKGELRRFARIGRPRGKGKNA